MKKTIFLWEISDFKTIFCSERYSDKRDILTCIHVLGTLQVDTRIVSYATRVDDILLLRRVAVDTAVPNDGVWHLPQHEYSHSLSSPAYYSSRACAFFSAWLCPSILFFPSCSWWLHVGGHSPSRLEADYSCRRRRRSRLFRQLQVVVDTAAADSCRVIDGASIYKTTKIKLEIETCQSLYYASLNFRKQISRQ